MFQAGKILTLGKARAQSSMCPALSIETSPRLVITPLITSPDCRIVLWTLHPAVGKESFGEKGLHDQRRSQQSSPFLYTVINSHTEAGRA